MRRFDNKTSKTLLAEFYVAPGNEQNDLQIELIYVLY